jgi:hypothetical protein
MPDYSLQVPWLAAPAFALVLVVWSQRWRGVGALVLGVLALVVGVWKGVLVSSDASWLLVHGGLAEGLAQLFMWTVFAILLRTHGRPVLRGHPMLIAPLMGALMGELAAAAILSAGARDSKGAARLALAAAGGAMWGRIGDPALLTLWNRGFSPMVLAMFGLVCVAIASPETEDLESDEEVDPIVTGACIAVAVLAVSRELAMEGLAIGCGVLLYQLRGEVKKADLRPLAWLLGGALTVLVAVSGGVMALAGLGLVELQAMWGEQLLIPLAGAGALLSAFCGGESASLIAVAIMERSPGLQIEGMFTALVGGLAVGGLGPLVVAGALKEGLLRWAVQVLAVVGLCAVVLL